MNSATNIDHNGKRDTRLEKPKATEPRIIAYFDILGYKEFLKDSDNDEYELLSSIRTEFSKLNAVNDKYAETNNALRIKTFSDNVIMAIKPTATSAERNALDFLARMICIVQLLFVERHNLLIRGSFLYGNILIDDTMVFGEGLVKAAELEAKDAIYPRIIVDDSITKRFGDSVFTAPYIAEDHDGKPYLDPFSIIDVYCVKHDTIQCLKTIRNNLVHRVKRYCKYTHNVADPAKIAAREKVISKHLWFIDLFNRFCENSNHDDLLIKIEPVLNERLMKFEIRILP